MPEYVPEVTRVEVAGRKLRLTSLDKVMYPSTETTKGEVLATTPRSHRCSCRTSPDGR